MLSKTLTYIVIHCHTNIRRIYMDFSKLKANSGKKFLEELNTKLAKDSRNQ